MNPNMNSSDGARRTILRQGLEVSPAFLPLKLIKRISDCTNRKPWPRQSLIPLYKKQNELLLAYYAHCFEKQLNELNRLQDEAEAFSDVSHAPIWMIWLQGRQEIPPELSICLDSVYRHKGSHPLHVLDLNEARNMVDIPDWLMCLYERKEIRPALLCDYIRAALLEHYGGIWLDTSVLLVKDIPDWILDTPFWSVKGLDFFPYSVVVPDGRQWQIYAMAGQPHALFYKGFCSLFLEYAKTINTDLDYFMSYQLSKLLRTNVAAIVESYDQIPHNNTKCESLQAYLQGYAPIRRQGSANLFCEDTFLYKLSRHNISLLRDNSQIIADLVQC